MKDRTLEVLNVLKKNFGNFVSGQEIGKILGISRVAVYKIIKKLISEGYRIKKVKNLGYKLLNLPFSPQDLLNENLKVVRQIYFYKSTTSTMDVAKELVSKNSNIENVLVIAETQTKGRGRLQREWFSPKGGLWFSLILKPKVSPDKIFFLNYVFSLAVVKTLKRYEINAKTKWPNDVVVDDKKICGILIETDTELDKVNWCIIGVGINVNIDSKFFLQNKLDATSVFEQTGKKVDLTEFNRILFKEIDILYDEFIKLNYDRILKDWCLNSVTFGRRVKILTLTDIIVGKAVGISPQTGALIVETPQGIKHILSGDCIHLRVKK